MVNTFVPTHCYGRVIGFAEFYFRFDYSRPAARKDESALVFSAGRATLLGDCPCPKPDASLLDRQRPDWIVTRDTKGCPPFPLNPLSIPHVLFTVDMNLNKNGGES